MGKRTDAILKEINLIVNQFMKEYEFFERLDRQNIVRYEEFVQRHRLWWRYVALKERVNP